MSGFFLKLKYIYWSKVIISSNLILYVFWLLCFFETGRSSLLCVSSVGNSCGFSPVQLSFTYPFLVQFCLFLNTFQTTRAFNLPEQNASHSRFVSPAKLNVLLTILSCRSLAETWNTNIFKSKSRKNPLVMLPLCSSCWHRSIDYPSEYSLCNNSGLLQLSIKHCGLPRSHRWCIKIVYWHRTSLVSGEQDILHNKWVVNHIFKNGIIFKCSRYYSEETYNKTYCQMKNR